jgi:alpha-L-fucosidase
MPTGEIAPEQATLLREIGAWLARYGESIYRTRGGPFKPGQYGVSTRKKNTVYLHLCEWPEGGLTLPALPCKVRHSRVLTGSKVNVSQTSAGLEVFVPARDRDALDTIVALELDRDADRLAAVAVPAPQFPAGLAAADGD